MSRFFQPTGFKFDDSFMYKPPWELAKEAMAYNDAGIDTALQTASMFNNIDISHIPDPVEEGLVKKELQFYQDKAKQYSTDIQLKLQNSPQSWKKYMPQIQNLGTDLSRNMKSGNLAKIQQSAAALTAWQEENKKIKEENPGLYNIGLSHYLNEWKANPNRSLDKTFSGDKLINFDPNSEKFQKALQNFKDHKNKTTRLQNGYIIETEGIDPQEIENSYYNLLMSDPNAIPYLQQMAKFKVPGFYNPNTGKPMEHFVYTSADNSLISESEFSKETIEYLNLPNDKKAYTVPPKRSFNPQFAWYGSIKAQGDILGSKSETVKEDPVVAKSLDRAHDFSLARYKHNLNSSLETQRQAGREKLAKIAAKAVKDPNGPAGKEYAEKVGKAIVEQKKAVVEQKGASEYGNKNLDYKKDFTLESFRTKLAKGNKEVSNVFNSIANEAVSAFGYKNSKDSYAIKMSKLDARAMQLLNKADRLGKKKEEAILFAKENLEREGYIESKSFLSDGDQVLYYKIPGKQDTPTAFVNLESKMRAYQDRKKELIEAQNSAQLTTHSYPVTAAGATYISAILENNRDSKGVVYRRSDNGKIVPEEDLKSDFAVTHVAGAYEGGSFTGGIGIEGKATINDEGKNKEVTLIATCKNPEELELGMLLDPAYYHSSKDYQDVKGVLKEDRRNSLERQSNAAATGSDYIFNYFDKEVVLTEPIKIQVSMTNKGREYSVYGIDTPMKNMIELETGITSLIERLKKAQ